MREPRWIKVGSYLVLIIAAIIAVLPAVWVFVTSFKVESEIFSTQVELVGRSGITFANYEFLLTRGDFQQWFMNSVIVAAAVTVIGVFLAATAAYGLSRYRFRGRNSALYVFLVAQMFPASSCWSPLFKFFANVGLIDPLGAGDVVTTIAIPFCVLMLKAYFDTIPFELEEAGHVDGLGVVGKFWRIVLPLSVWAWR